MYLAITAEALIYQHYNWLTGRMEHLVIPRQAVLRLKQEHYSGDAESPSCGYGANMVSPTGWRGGGWGDSE
ncbi:MAG: hypothetical protein ACP5QU_01180 [Anaerolineae bacterium]